MSIVLQEKGISFKVILIGESGTGKSSLIRKYIYGSFATQYNLTVGVDFSSKIVFLGTKPIQLQIWDTCGQDVFKSITNSFYKGAGAVFLVFSLDNSQSFHKLQRWLKEFYEKGSTNAMVFLIGTKSDLQRKVSLEEAVQFMNKHNCSFFIQTSSKEGQKIQELFQKAAQTMYKYYQINPQFRDLIKPDRSTLTPNTQNFSKFSLIQSVFEEDFQLKKKKRCCH